MPTITIGRTSKRINSTSRAYTSSLAVSCTLREPCSMQNPVFRFTLDSGHLDAGFYNYAVWGSWYYWIDDIIYLSNYMLEIHCHLDPLATFRADIRNTSAFVVYGPSEKWNKDIDDTRFQPEISPSMHRHTYAMSMFKTKDSGGSESGINCSSSGTIIMTFTQTASVDWISNLSPHDNQAETQVTPNGVHTALLTWGQFRDCFADLNDFGSNIVPSSLPQNIGDACLEIIQAFGRAIQSTSGGSLLDNIQRIIWVPLSYSDLVTQTGAQSRYGLMLGGILAPNIQWAEIPSTLVLTFNNYITYDLTTQASDLLPDPDLRFLLNDRFTSVQVVTPGGYNDIGSNCLRYSESKIYMKTALSVASGEWSMKLSKESDHYDSLASFAGTIGVNLMGSVSAVPNASMQLGIAGAKFVGGALSMGVGSIVGGVAAGESMVINTPKQNKHFQHYESENKAISSGIQHMVPQTDFRADFPSGNFGGGSSGLFLTDTPGMMAIYAACFPPADISNYKSFCGKYGYPVNAFMKLSTTNIPNGSYVQCSGASVEPLNGTGAGIMSESNKSTINSYLNSGIYLE